MTIPNEIFERSLKCSVTDIYLQGRIQKFFEGGVLKNFCMNGKIKGGVGIFFLKTPSKLKKFSQKDRGFDPKNPSLNTPLST